MNGTAAADVIGITANAGAVTIAGLPAVVRIDHAEPAFDVLTINGLGGADIFSVGAGVAALIGVVTNQ